jgi:hypothetical protein
MALITLLKISFAGSFQARLAVGMDPGESSPTDPYGTYGKKSLGLGVSATYAYQEKPFDRIVRLSQPVDLRNARMDPWEDTTVKSVQIVAGKGVQSVPPGNPLLGQVVSLGNAAKFIEDVGYLVDSMVLSIAAFFSAKPVGEVGILAYRYDNKAKAEYQTKKPALITAIGPMGFDLVRLKVLAENAKGNFATWSDIFTNIAPYHFYLDPPSVQFSAGFSDGSAMERPANYWWAASLVFSHWDADTLGGQLSGDIAAIHESVLQPGAKMIREIFGRILAMAIPG